MFSPNACSAAAPLTPHAVALDTDPDMGAQERPVISSCLSAAALDRFEDELELFWRSSTWTDSSPRVVACGLVRLPGWPDVPVLLETPTTATLFTRRHAPIERVGNAAPGWPGHSVIKRAVCLKQEDDPERWEITDKSSRRYETVLPGGTRGDDLLCALLRVWPEGPVAGRPPRTVAGLRRHIAITLLDATSKERRYPGSMPWLASLMPLDGRRPVAPAHASMLSVHATSSPPALGSQTWQGASNALPGSPLERSLERSLARPVERPLERPVWPGISIEPAEVPPEPARLAALAEYDLRAGRLTKACQQLEAIRPASEVPLKLMGRFCERAEKSGRPDLAMELIETLWNAGGLFRPAGSWPKVGFRLTLSPAALFEPFPPGHHNHDTGNYGLTPAVAKAVLKIHLQADQLKPGSMLRWPCIAPFKAAISEELQGRGLDAVKIENPDDSDRYETLLIHELPPEGAAAPQPAGESVAALRLRQVVSDGIDCVRERSEVALKALLIKASRQLPISQILDILKTTQGSKAWVYRHLAADAAVHPDASILPQLLEAWQSELGAISSDDWLTLMRGWTGADRWPACQHVAGLMQAQGQPLAVEHLQAMYESVIARKHVLEAIADFNARLAAGMAPNVGLTKALLRGTAMAGLPTQARRFLNELKTYRVQHDDDVRLSEIILHSQTGLLEAALSDLDRLRNEGVKPDLQTLRALLCALWKNGRRDEAADMVIASVEAGDDLYTPELGLQHPDGSNHLRLNLTAPAVHRHDTSRDALAFSFLSEQEILTLVHLHGRSGRLKEDMQLQVPSRLVSVRQRGAPVTRQFDDLLNDCLRHFGLRAPPMASRDGRWSSTHVIRTLEPAVTDP